MSIFHILLLILSTLPLLREAFYITGKVIDCPKLKGRVIRFIMEVEKYRAKMEKLKDTMREKE